MRMFTFFVYIPMRYDEIWHRLATVYEPGEAKAVARMLLEEKFGMTHADILCGGVEALSADDTLWLESAVARLERSVPVQYVLGETLFCGNRIAVGEGVLIPRPETEWLVERAVAEAGGGTGSGRGDGLRLLDIGTGSGCIAVSLKKALPGAYVEAWDVSADAIDIAEGNALRLGADITFRECDALKAQPGGERWDIVVSNPPYVCDSERAGMDANVLEHEPATALFVPDSDPLLFYRAITRYAAATLRAGGRLLFECNTRFAGDTAEMMRAEGFGGTAVADDCFGMPRFAEGRKKE